MFGGFINWIYHHILVSLGHGFKFAFGSWWPWAAGVITIALGAGLAYVILRRRSHVERVRSNRVLRGTDREDPDELDRRARAAVAEGSYDIAVRLWFVAGVLRLTTRGFLVHGEVRTNRELLRAVPSATFGDLARRHEQIVYGQQPATIEDARNADRGWVSVLREVTVRETS